MYQQLTGKIKLKTFIGQGKKRYVLFRTTTCIPFYILDVLMATGIKYLLTCTTWSSTMISHMDTMLMATRKTVRLDCNSWEKNIAVSDKMFNEKEINGIASARQTLKTL